MLIVSRIEELRNAKNISQSEIANEIGRTRNWYAMMLKKEDLMISDLIKIANVLDVREKYFFGYKEGKDIKFDEESTLFERLKRELYLQTELNEVRASLIERQRQEIENLKKERAF